MALTAVAGGAAAVELRKRLRRGDASWLRNDQGVGPAHYRGTHRGEERAARRSA
jgi:hypothetical protein